MKRFWKGCGALWLGLLLGGVFLLDSLLLAWARDWHLTWAAACPKASGGFGAAALAALASLFLLLLLCLLLSALGRRQRHMEALAYADPLTGLRNANKLALDLERALQGRRSKAYAVWSMEIRQLPALNGLSGAELGNDALGRVAQLLQAEEAPGRFGARVAADQFAGLRPYEGAEELMDWFWSLCASLNRRALLAGGHRKLDCAMGVYLVSGKDGGGAAEAVSRADIAEKEAKGLPGTQVVFYSPELEARVRRRAKLLAGAAGALAAGELCCFLQPKIACKGNERPVVGAEALARWKHPEYGLLSPGEFIPLFEETGFIVELDRYMLEEACRWSADRTGKGFAALPVSVNVSRQGLLQDDFVAYYQEIKECYGIADGLLELEFTESLAFDGYDRVQPVVQALQSCGFRCAIDDFGSGYSSLHMLKHLPVDVLKLDGALFQEGGDDRRGRFLIACVLGMAQALGMQTVAEGVETWAQADLLGGMGCDLIQGYACAPPLPPEDFAAYLASREQGAPPEGD